MELCWTEADMDERVNFVRGETEHGEIGSIRVLISRSAFPFRDFRSHALLLCNREFLRDTALGAR